MKLFSEWSWINKPLVPDSDPDLSDEEEFDLLYEDDDVFENADEDFKY